MAIWKVTMEYHEIKRQTIAVEILDGPDADKEAVREAQRLYPYIPSPEARPGWTLAGATIPKAIIAQRQWVDGEVFDGIAAFVP